MSEDEKRSDRVGGNIDEDMVIKSRAIEDSGEDPEESSEMCVHKLEIIATVSRKLRKRTASNDIEASDQDLYRWQESALHAALLP